MFTISVPQGGIITALDPNLETSFSSGVQNTSLTSILPPIQNYNQLLTASRPFVRDYLEYSLAVMMPALGIQNAFPTGLWTSPPAATWTGITTDVTVVTGVDFAHSVASTSTLHFANGLLISVT